MTEEEDNDQNTLPDQSEIDDGSKQFGDYQGVIQDEHLRLLFVNINGIPTTADNPKNTMIRESINRTGASIVGFAETNTSWRKLRGKNRWEERSFGWWENMRSVTSHNTLEYPKNLFQPGGNLMMTRGKIQFRIIASGVDPSNMGRWCWQLFSGKKGVTTRVITAYRPCKSGGITSTYVQQRRILDAKKIETCPREQMIQDLVETITEWMSNGDQIILMLDLNDDVLNSRAGRKLRSIGLRECLTHRHDDSVPTSTCNRGTKIIDGIYVSSTILIQKGGYCPFNTFPTDHRALWIDLTLSNLCGNKMAQVINPQARRLKCNDPKTQDKWTRLYLTALKDKNAIQQIYDLQRQLA